MNYFIGKWRITGMEQWDQDYIDLVEPGYVKFENNGLGAFVFGTVNGFTDCRISKEKNREIIEFTWEGTSECDRVCGRGWFEKREKNQIYGRLFIHNGDDSWVKAVRE